VEVRLPPLRERVQDIPLLVQHFVEKHGGDRPPSVSRQVIEFLMAYRWPGNIRQLENEIMRALVLCDDVMEIEHLSGVILEGSSFSMEDPTDLAMDRQVERLKKRLIRRALEKTQGKRSKAAQILGVSRYGLQKMMIRMGM
jgi:serine/threonine-protein kinase PknK